MQKVVTEFLDRLFTEGDIDGAMELTTDRFSWTVGGKPGGGFALAGTYDREGFVRMLGQAGASVPAGPQIDIVSVTLSNRVGPTK